MPKNSAFWIEHVESYCYQGAVSGFSGQKLYNDILYQFYNVAGVQVESHMC